MADDLDYLRALIESGPEGPANNARRPIGVPEDYAVPHRVPAPSVGRAVGAIDYQPGGVYYQPPRYFNGDEWVPAQGSVEDIARLQMDMYRRGILYQDFTLGVWDNNSRNAYKGILGFANGAGITWQEAMARYGMLVDQGARRRGRGGGGGGGGGRGKLPVRLTNPDDIRAVAENVSRQVLGRVPDDPEFVGRMISAYHAAEAGAQRAAYAGGTFTAEPNLQAFAEKKVREAAPTEALGHDFAADTMNAFTAILDGQFGGFGE